MPPSSKKIYFAIEDLKMLPSFEARHIYVAIAAYTLYYIYEHLKLKPVTHSPQNLLQKLKLRILVWGYVGLRLGEFFHIISALSLACQ